MTIEKGKSWGTARPLPEDGIVVRTDAEARRVVESARAEGRPVPTLGLLGGDLCRTLGGLGDESRLRSPEAMTFPCDIGRIRADGRDHWFVAHAILRRVAWIGRAVAVMNAQWLDSWDLSPRAHPDDGLLDVTDGALPIGELLEARRRVRTGTHVPHPALHVSRVAELTLDLARPLGLWLDGERMGRARIVEACVEPDAIQVVV